MGSGGQGVRGSGGQGKNIGKDAASYPLDLFAELAFHARYLSTPLPLSLPLLEAAGGIAVHSTGEIRRT